MRISCKSHGCTIHRMARLMRHSATEAWAGVIRVGRASVCARLTLERRRIMMTPWRGSLAIALTRRLCIVTTATAGAELATHVARAHFAMSRLWQVPVEMLSLRPSSNYSLALHLVPCQFNHTPFTKITWIGPLMNIRNTLLILSMASFWNSEKKTRRSDILMIPFTLREGQEEVSVFYLFVQQANCRSTTNVRIMTFFLKSLQKDGHPC